MTKTKKIPTELRFLFFASREKLKLKYIPRGVVVRAKQETRALFSRLPHRFVSSS